MEGKGLNETFTVSTPVHGERYSSCADLMTSHVGLQLNFSDQLYVIHDSSLCNMALASVYCLLMSLSASVQSVVLSCTQWKKMTFMNGI